MKAREELTGHYAGCTIRPVTAYQPSGHGTLVTLECGHSHFTGSQLHQPTHRPCLEGPCYRQISGYVA